MDYSQEMEETTTQGVAKHQSPFEKFTAGFSRVLLKFGGSKVVGVIAIVAVLTALPLTVATLQQRQTLQQRASGTAATQPCASDMWSVHRYVGPLDSQMNPITYCDGVFNGMAEYYCRSDTFDGFGEPDKLPNGSYPNDFRNAMRTMGQKVMAGQIKFYRLKHKDGYYSGPAEGWFMRSDSPAQSNGRAMDNDSGVIYPVPPMSARNDLKRLFEQGKIIVEGVCGETPPPTQVPVATAIPTAAPTIAPTAVPTGAPTVIPTSSTAGTQPIALQLIGIGIGEDTGSDGSIIARTAPQTATRTVTVQTVNASDQVIGTTNSTLTYDATDGLFKGNIGMPAANGSYTIKLTVPGYLRRQIPGIVTIPFTGTLPTIPKLIAGDLNADNSLDAADYNLFSASVTNCNAPSPTPRPSALACQQADLNNDGQLDLTDYKIMFVGLLTRSGD